MKKLIVTIAMMMAMMLALPVSANTGGVDSLRGGEALEKDSKAYSKKKQINQKGGFERSFKQQPPMIPHSIEKDKITLKVNTCMKCHSEKNYQKEKAPKVGDSHFIDRDGNKLTKMSARRHFCNQCHAPQVDAKPLVRNDF